MALLALPPRTNGYGQHVGRAILHVDLDQFIVAVELLRRPELSGQPVIVGDEGDLTRRGVVAGASYEARAFGIRSGMPLRRAAARCHDLICLPLDRDAYLAASAAVMEILHAWPGVIVEEAGWDEAYLELDTSDPVRVARAVQFAVQDGTGLACSVGIGDNKLQAKSATALGKPHGVARLSGATWARVMGPRGVEALFGIGAKTRRRLRALGISTISELADADADLLAHHFGPKTGPHLRRIALGKGAMRVSPQPLPAHSYGHEITFQEDLADPLVIADEVRKLAETVADELGRKGRSAQRVIVTVRFAPFETHSHGVAVEDADQPDAIVRAAMSAFAGFTRDGAVRLVGVRAELDMGDFVPTPPTRAPSAGEDGQEAQRQP